jgi:hypothetical protein
VAYGRELEQNTSTGISILRNYHQLLALDDENIDFHNREMHNVVITLDGRKEDSLTR